MIQELEENDSEHVPVGEPDINTDVHAATEMAISGLRDLINAMKESSPAPVRVRRMRVRP